VAAVTMPPLNPHGGTRGQQFAAHLAAVRPYLDKAYAEGFVAGMAYTELRTPARIMLVDKETLDQARKLADGGT
jgi:hypothetical protein